MSTFSRRIAVLFFYGDRKSGERRRVCDIFTLQDLLAIMHVKSRHFDFLQRKNTKLHPPVRPWGGGRLLVMKFGAEFVECGIRFVVL